MTIHPLKTVLDSDPRYPVEAYEFVRDALAYAQDVMGLGAPHEAARRLEDDTADAEELADDALPQERHLTGQQLCEACRQLALRQYGLMANVVLRTWGIETTSDFGSIVYNLIDVDLMRKSSADRREDFDDVYDFDEAFEKEFDFAQEVQRQS